MKPGPVINYVVSIVAPEVSFPPPATAATQKRLDLQQVSGGTLAPNGFDYLLKWDQQSIRFLLIIHLSTIAHNSRVIPGILPDTFVHLNILFQRIEFKLLTVFLRLIWRLLELFFCPAAQCCFKQFSSGATSAGVEATVHKMSDQSGVR